MTEQPLGGIPVTQGFKANSPNDPNWIGINNELFDGLKTVKTLNDMYSIPLQRLREGTSLCFVLETLLIYRLKRKPTSGSTQSADWSVWSPESSQQVLNPLGPITPGQVSGLLPDTGEAGDFYLVSEAGSAGLDIDNQAVFGKIISVQDGDWILKGANGWTHLKMAFSVPQHSHDVAEVYVTEADGTTLTPLMDHLSGLYLGENRILAGNQKLDKTGEGSKLPMNSHVIEYVNRLISGLGAAGVAVYKVADEAAMLAHATDTDNTVLPGHFYVIGANQGIYLYVGDDKSVLDSYVLIFSADELSRLSAAESAINANQNQLTTVDTKINSVDLRTASYLGYYASEAELPTPMADSLALVGTTLYIFELATTTWAPLKAGSAQEMQFSFFSDLDTVDYGARAIMTGAVTILSETLNNLSSISYLVQKSGGAEETVSDLQAWVTANITQESDEWYFTPIADFGVNSGEGVLRLRYEQA